MKLTAAALGVFAVILAGTGARTDDAIDADWFSTVTAAIAESEYHATRRGDAFIPRLAADYRRDAGYSS